MVFNLSNTLKQPSSFASCSLIKSIDITDVLIDEAIPCVGMHNPLERILTDEDLD